VWKILSTFAVPGGGEEAYRRKIGQRPDFSTSLSPGSSYWFDAGTLIIEPLRRRAF
jgi:hypothetical protein